MVPLVSAPLAQEASPPLVHYRLDNGLEVILAPDSRAPKIVLNVAYKVGSMNEPPGRSGYAHLFEHLMFSGTPAYPNIDAAYGALGVSLNAWTYEDQTLYYGEGLNASLPYMLALEADRMANQGQAITAEDLDIQRAVVLNEIRETVLDTPAGSGWEAFRSVLFPAGHPYYRPVLGSIADIERATIADVHGFFATYYVPNNAILSLVGDFEVDEARDLIAQTFGLVPRGAEVTRPVAGPVPPAAARLALEDVVAAPSVSLGWATPAEGSADSGALRLAGELIGNWEYGLLRARLVDTGLATDFSAWIEDGALASRFFIEITVADGAAPEAVEAALRDALSDFAAGPIDVADFERFRRKLLQEDKLAVEPFKARAEALILSTVTQGQPEVAVVPDPRLLAATPEGTLAVVRRLLGVADASTMILTPGARGSYPDVLTQSSGTSETLVVPERGTIAIPSLAARPAVPGTLPVRQEAQLSNGLDLVHYQVAGAPLTYVAVAAGTGTTSVPPGKEGIVELAVGMAPRGAADRDFASFARAAKDLDADVSSTWGVQSAFVTLSVPAEALTDGAALLADAVQRPRFDAGQWESLVDETLFGLEQRDEDLQDLARRVAESVLFPTRVGAPANDRSLVSVGSLDRAETAAFFRQLFAPGSATIYSVGPMPVAEVAAALEPTFGSWVSDAQPLVPRLRPAAAFPDARQVLFLAKPGASQSAIHIASAAPGNVEAGAAEALTVSRLLGDDFISRINAVIREEKGYSYGTDGSVYDSIAVGSLMAIEAPVEADHTADALADMLAGYASLRSAPVRADEVQRTATAMLTRIAGTAETAAGLFDTVVQQVGIGSSLEAVHARRLAVAGLDDAAVGAMAEKLAGTEMAVIAIVGDPAVVLPQLEALGLTVKTVSLDAL